MRWIKYGVVFILTLYFYRSISSTYFRYIVKSLFLILVLIIIIVILNPAGVGEYLQYFHSPKDTYLFSNFHEPGVFRLGGTFNNPNDNGVLLSLFFLLFALHESIKDYYFAFLALVLVVLTQSRTAILLSIGIVLIWIIYHFIKTKVNLKQFLSGILTFIVVFTFFSIFNFDYVTTLFTGKAFESNSFITRIDNFSTVTSASNELLILGHGVISDQIAVFGKYLDSELTLVIAQFGIIGLVIWLLFITAIVKIAIKKDVHTKLFISFIILYSGTSITNLSFFHTQLGILLFAFLGISFERTNKMKAKSSKKT